MNRRRFFGWLGALVAAPAASKLAAKAAEMTPAEPVAPPVVEPIESLGLPPISSHYEWEIDSSMSGGPYRPRFITMASTMSAMPYSWSSTNARIDLSSDAMPIDWSTNV